MTNDIYRINKYISMCGYCSRRQADTLIDEGKVTVDGIKAVSGTKVTQNQVVIVNGQKIELQNTREVYAFYKPIGYISSLSDEQGTGIGGFIKTDLRLFPVGRLDKDSEGLMILTNDGELMNSVLKASNAHEKEYLVKVNRPITAKFIERMSKGVPITNGNTGEKIITAPCKIQQIDDRTFSITLIQGLNRQIRRMCGYFEYKVINLKRIRIMNIEIGKMRPGEYRLVSGDELAQIMDKLRNN